MIENLSDWVKIKKHKIPAEEHCNYIGHLAIERDACVAVSGCFGSEDVDLRIMSTHSIGSTGYVWKQDGQIFQFVVDHKVMSNSF